MDRAIVNRWLDRIVHGITKRLSASLIGTRTIFSKTVSASRLLPLESLSSQVVRLLPAIVAVGVGGYSFFLKWWLRATLGSS